MKVVAYTHQGPDPKYDHNEDSIVINDMAISNQDYTYLKSFMLRHTGVFAVCDGVGGHFGGEIASSALVNAITEHTTKEKVTTQTNVQTLAYKMKQAVEATHVEYGNDEMMSTFVGVFLNSKQIIFANVGDSPSFLFRDGKLEMMSTLDTYENKLRSEGVSAEEIAKLDTAHYITSAFGMKSLTSSSVHVVEKTTQRGDKYLLMSDGVYDYFDLDEICSLLNEYKDIKQFANHIEKLVLERGAHDNYSLIVIEY